MRPRFIRSIFALVAPLLVAAAGLVTIDAGAALVKVKGDVAVKKGKSKKVKSKAKAKAKAKATADDKAKALPALPKVDVDGDATKSNEDDASKKAKAKAKAKDDEEAAAKAKAKAKAEADEPPPELTGSLPEAKLATKSTKKDDKAKDEGSDKKKKPADAKADAPAEKKGEKSKDDAKKTKDAADKDDKDDKKTKAKDGKADDGSKSFPFPDLAGADKTGIELKKPKVKNCLHSAVTFARLGQPTDVAFVLTTCSGKAAPGAVDYLSILARPAALPAPTWMKSDAVLAIPGQEFGKPSAAVAKTTAKNEIAPGIIRVDPGLVFRLQAISDHFPGRTITLVSGYRPMSKGSPHSAGRAFDIRIDGVTNEVLVDFCKTLQDTGCGYYPNSYFVHVDVRAAGVGHVYWIDISGPGEKPVYVKSWPPPSLPKLPDVKATKATKDESKLEPLPDAVENVSPTIDESSIGPLDDDPGFKQ